VLFAVGARSRGVEKFGNDPDSKGRWTNTSVPDNVKMLYNWYQTHGEGASTPKESHGRALTIVDPNKTKAKQENLNPAPGGRETNMYPVLGSIATSINHVSIIFEVESRIINVLK
jgi:hypothetical protein